MTDDESGKQEQEKLAQIAAARQLLIDSGMNVLDQQQLGARIAKEQAKAESLRAQLETEAAARKAAEEKLQGIANQGKSVEQLHAEQRAEWQRRDADMAAQLKAEREAREATERKTRDFVRDRRLGDLLVGAVDPELARVWAREKLPGLSADPDGSLRFMDAAGIEHVGTDAERIVSDWWSKQAALRRAAGAGPPAGGSVTPPDRREDYQYGRPGADITARIQEAERFNKQRRKGR